MLSAENQPLYVGKARNLRDRVESYTNPRDFRIQKMVEQVADIRFLVTKTNEEALILEMSNIKSMKPKYNILLKDGKTFPEILITTWNNFPGITKHRGKKEQNGLYFGPFVNSDNVSKTIEVVKKIFKIRTCSDGEFKSRTRPCLQYQIKCCSAPCVGLISQEDYSAKIKQVTAFLKGKTGEIQKDLSQKMQQYSDEMEFEKAMQMRDTISAISSIQISDNIQILSEDNMDVLGIFANEQMICIHLFLIRNGYNCGNMPYFFEINDEIPEILYQFIYQFYGKNPPPAHILLNNEVNYQEELSQILGTKISQSKDKRLEKILEFANNNAKNSLEIKMHNLCVTDEILLKIQETFNLSEVPNRIEIFDNSHISGTNAVGGMVVATKDGFEKSSYKRYNFKDFNINPGDDYAMMREMLTRRLVKVKELIAAGEMEKVPNLWLIDGGVGHMSVVISVMENIGLELPFICISKGENRNAGLEEFHTRHEKHITIDPKSKLMYFLQTLRDEAHKFAISNHRFKRSKDSIRSILDEIPNIGNKRKQALLKHFGSPQLVRDASVADLCKVEGINQAIAQKIYDFLH